MTYSVKWGRNAVDAILRILLRYDAANRVGVTQAIAAVDEMLRSDPGEHGESRDGDHRILFMPPLIVIFQVDELGGIVYILDVRANK